VGVLKVGGIFVHKGGIRRLGRKRILATEALMPATPAPAPRAADVQALAQAIREATDAEIEELARTLLATDDQHLFGATEFQVRALAHKIAAKALTQHLARKKTATSAPA
jgi:hypothetical protein